MPPRKAKKTLPEKRQRFFTTTHHTKAGARSPPLSSVASQQQRVGPLHEARRIFQRTTFREQRLIEQQMAPVVEIRAVGVQVLHERVLRVHFQDRMRRRRLLRSTQTPCAAWNCCVAAP